jgi:hypothetical protein
MPLEDVGRCHPNQVLVSSTEIVAHEVFITDGIDDGAQLGVSLGEKLQERTARGTELGTSDFCDSIFESTGMGRWGRHMPQVG